MSTPLDGWIAVLPNRCSLAGICRHVTQEATTTWPPFQRTQHASRQLQAMKKKHENKAKSKQIVCQQTLRQRLWKRVSNTNKLRWIRFERLEWIREGPAQCKQDARRCAEVSSQSVGPHSNPCVFVGQWTSCKSPMMMVIERAAAAKQPQPHLVVTVGCRYNCIQRPICR